MRSLIELIGLLLVVVAGTLAVLGVMAAGHEYATVRGKIAAIEQLREDAGRLRGAEASGVLALVARANGEIAYHQAMNAHPLLGWSTPNRWADVRPIRIRLLREMEPVPERPGSPPSGDEPAPHFGYTPNRTESELFIRSLERGAKP